MNETMWKPKVGDPFPLRLMSDEHLNNAILMLRRFGYITTTEAGDMPDNPIDAVVWASKPASALLDRLAEERLARIEAGQAPFSEEQAATEQAQWRIRQQEAERARRVQTMPPEVSAAMQRLESRRRWQERHNREHQHWHPDYR